jgi:hypothetical protein
MKLFQSFAAFAVLLLTSSSSLAAVSVETELFGPGTPNFNTLLNFNKFNPALGTLTSVMVEMQVSAAGGSLTVDNDGVGPASVAVELGAEGNVSSVDVNLLNNLFQPVVADVTASTANIYNLGAENGDGPSNVDGSGPDGAVLLGGNVSDTDSGFINSTFHPQYIGAAQTFNITAEIDQILDFGSVGGVEGAFTPVSASGYVRVTYTYDAAVPEPASMALIAFGIGVLGLKRRCR